MTAGWFWNEATCSGCHPSYIKKQTFSLQQFTSSPDLQQIISSHSNTTIPQHAGLFQGFLRIIYTNQSCPLANYTVVQCYLGSSSEQRMNIDRVWFLHKNGNIQNNSHVLSSLLLCGLRLQVKALLGMRSSGSQPVTSIPTTSGIRGYILRGVATR